MNRLTKLIASVFTLVLALSFAIRAEDTPAAATGTVLVMVTDKDGKPVEGATVRVTLPRQVAPKADQKLPDEQKPTEQKPTDKPSRPGPVAEGKTDKEGKLTLQKIPAGLYNLSANLKDAGSAREKLELKAGEMKSVELKLQPRPVTAK